MWQSMLQPNKERIALEASWSLLRNRKLILGCSDPQEFLSKEVMLKHKLNFSFKERLDIATFAHGFLVSEVDFAQIQKTLRDFELVFLQRTKDTEAEDVPEPPIETFLYLITLASLIELAADLSNSSVMFSSMLNDTLKKLAALTQHRLDSLGPLMDKITYSAVKIKFDEDVNELCVENGTQPQVSHGHGPRNWLPDNVLLPQRIRPHAPDAGEDEDEEVVKENLKVPDQEIQKAATRRTTRSLAMTSEVDKPSGLPAQKKRRVGQGPQPTKGKSAWSEIEISALKSLVKKFSRSEQDHKSDNRAGVHQWTQMKAYDDLHEKTLSKRTVTMMRNKYRYLID
ncbi:hypothetical protein BG003_007334 [Podila horticola]|nr:hypothetical protein BG003_007334 [Podila horticola]